MRRSQIRRPRTPRRKTNYASLLELVYLIHAHPELVNRAPGHALSLREFRNGVGASELCLLPGGTKMEMGLAFHYVSHWSVLLFIHLC